MPDALRDPCNPLDAISLAIDGVRSTVHEVLGSRTYRVYVVTRRWSGGRIGEGYPTDDVLELLPRPLVEAVSHDRLGPAGREHEGDLRLSEVSLGYSAAELAPQPGPGSEFAYRIADATGQGQPDRWGIPAAEPLSRRGDRHGDNADWYVVLKQTAPLGPLDGVEAGP